MAQRIGRHRQYRNQVLRLVFGVIVQKEEQGGFVVGTTPDTVTCQKFRRIQCLVAAPQLVGVAAPCQELPQAHQNRYRPDQMPPRQPHHAAEIAPHIEGRALTRGQSEHKMRAHQVQHRGFHQARRRNQVPVNGLEQRTLGHPTPPAQACALSP